MALKLIVDTIESIPEAMRSSYVERDGKFHLDVDGIEDTSDLKSRLTAANKEAADRRKALETWKGIGKTPEEIAALVHAREQDELSNAEKKGEWEKLKAQMNEKHGVE